METKKFKPFDRVLVKGLPGERWNPDLYSFYDDIKNLHWSIGCGWSSDENILPYEGNEELVGTTDSPEEEVRLEIGEIIIAIDKEDYECGFSDGVIGKTIKFKNKLFERNGKWGFSVPGGCHSLAIRFSDFNPDDMEETKKHILCVKNGKIIKYKG